MMTSGIIVAAGSGARVGKGENKLLHPLGGRPVIWWTLKAVSQSQAISELILVTREELIPQLQALVKQSPFAPRVSHIVRGGKERQHSVSEGLRHVDPRADYVLVHDGARPLVTPEIIDTTLRAAEQTGAAVAATPLSDTVKSFREEGTVAETLNREQLWTVQTPQVFRRDLLLKAHQTARQENYVATDDAALVEKLGHPVRLVETKQHNLKITTPEDYPLVESILKARGLLAQGSPRVGFGYDVHRFAEGRPLFLGGVRIESPEGLEGHSDADVLLHAVCDALLGAVGQRDLGYHFPDTDAAFENISSLRLLERVVEVLRETGHTVSNIDCVVIAEQPRLSDYVPGMVDNIAQTVGVPANSISVKATTNEGLGFLGKCQGMMAQAVATVIPMVSGE